jgi:hypothetical protein
MPTDVKDFTIHSFPVDLRKSLKSLASEEGEFFGAYIIGVLRKHVEDEKLTRLRAIRKDTMDTIEKLEDGIK